MGQRGVSQNAGILVVLVLSYNIPYFYTNALYEAQAKVLQLLFIFEWTIYKNVILAFLQYHCVMNSIDVTFFLDSSGIYQTFLLKRILSI